MNEISRIQHNEIQLQQSFNIDYFERFIRYIDASEKTVATYTRALKQFFKYLALNNVREPQRADILAYRDDLKSSGHKPTTIQNYITAIRIFFQWLEQEQLYPNIADKIKGAKLDKSHKKDYLTGKQAKAVLDSIDKSTLTGVRDYAILSLMVTGGLRTIEVSRACIGDLRALGGNTVLYIQGKGRDEKTEYIKVSETVEYAIREYLSLRTDPQDNQALFTSTSNRSKGKALSTRSISGIVKSAFKKAGYDSERLTAHSLRHTAITLAILAGQDITEVQQFARHSNLNTTMIYNHALDRSKNKCSDAITNAIF